MQNTAIFGLTLPSPGKVFGLDLDGHKGPLKNFKLESSLMILQITERHYIHEVERGRPRSKMSTGVINSAGNDSGLKVVAMGMQRRGADQEILAAPEFGD